MTRLGFLTGFTSLPISVHFLPPKAFLTERSVCAISCLILEKVTGFLLLLKYDDVHCYREKTNGSR